MGQNHARSGILVDRISLALKYASCVSLAFLFNIAVLALSINIITSVI